MRQNTSADFWARVDRRGPDECWPWKGSRSHGTYGHFVIGNRQYRSHRYAWEDMNGPIPEGMVLLHTCDNPPCCNPAHLRFGTNQENTADRDAKGRTAAGERNGARRHPETRAGERNGRAKLTWTDVHVIRVMHGAGSSLADLARRYPVSRQTVRQIVRGEIWKEPVRC